MKNIIFILSILLAYSAHAQFCEPSIPADTPVSRFILNNSQGTAFDKKTGLTWMRCVLGQNWNSATRSCSGDSVGPITWQDALSAAETAVFAGFSNWRLPNIKELNSIVEKRCISPAINLTLFPLDTSTPYKFWSGTVYGGGMSSGSAWIVDYGMFNGTNGADNMWENGLNGFDTHGYGVRLVREGE
jgi:hypothetical protein